MEMVHFKHFEILRKKKNNLILPFQIGHLCQQLGVKLSLQPIFKEQGAIIQLIRPNTNSNRGQLPFAAKLSHRYREHGYA